MVDRRWSWSTVGRWSWSTVGRWSWSMVDRRWSRSTVGRWSWSIVGRSGRPFLSPAKFLQQPWHVGADRVKRRRPADGPRPMASYALIDGQRICIDAHLLPRLVERNVPHAGRPREVPHNAFDDDVDRLVCLIVRVKNARCLGAG